MCWITVQGELFAPWTGLIRQQTGLWCNWLALKDLSLVLWLWTISCPFLWPPNCGMYFAEPAFCFADSWYFPSAKMATSGACSLRSRKWMGRVNLVAPVALLRMVTWGFPRKLQVRRFPVWPAESQVRRWIGMYLGPLAFEHFCVAASCTLGKKPLTVARRWENSSKPAIVPKSGCGSMVASSWLVGKLPFVQPTS